MAARPFTQEWADAFREAINASPEYRESGKGWVWPLALALEATPELGYAESTAILLDLSEGHCEKASVTAADTVSAPYVLWGDYKTWKEIIRGELDPIAAILLRKLHLTGSIATIAQHASAAEALVRCAAAVPTEFPDEVADDV